jgi:hypothetical protein
LSFGGHGDHTAVGVHELTRLVDHQSSSPVEVEHDAQRLKVQSEWDRHDRDVGRNADDGSSAGSRRGPRTIVCVGAG